MKAVSVFAALAVLMSCFSPPASAGVYSDDLSRCLVESSTSEDKLVLVKWMFAAISLHPAVRSMASVSSQQVDEANKGTADLFIKLITETCKEQTVKAIKYEGEAALHASFNVFGQVAAKEIFSNAEVAAGIAGLEKYMDAEKIRSALQSE